MYWLRLVLLREDRLGLGGEELSLGVWLALNLSLLWGTVLSLWLRLHGQLVLLSV